jgi:hypothetical protein
LKFFGKFLSFLLIFIVSSKSSAAPIAFLIALIMNPAEEYFNWLRKNEIHTVKNSTQLGWNAVMICSEIIVNSKS